MDIVEDLAADIGPVANALLAEGATGLDDGMAEALGRLGFGDPAAAWTLLGECHGVIPPDDRRPHVMRLLAVLATLPEPGRALLRFTRLVTAEAPPPGLWPEAARRLERLLALLGYAPGLTDVLLGRPALLAGLVADGLPPVDGDAAALGASLADRLGSGQDGATLRRQWLNEGWLALGARIVDGRLDAAAAGPAYTGLAERIIESELEATVDAFRAAHGEAPDSRFAVFALGKLGGREMSPGSDLDLVLVYDVPDLHRPSTGPQPLAAAVYYSRLCNALLAALTRRQGAEALYEIDVRLSPWARKAAAATNVESFRRYYGGEAWTWELMALTRGRAIAGDAGLMTELDATAQTILRQPRDAAALVRDVDQMRRRIARHHPAEAPWDAKRRPGGLVDIEFIAQYLMLREAAARPEVLAVGTAEALRRLAAAGALDAGAAEELNEALRLWARLTCLTRLTRGAVADTTAWRTLIARMVSHQSEDLSQAVEATSRRVRAHYDRLIAGPAA